MIVSLAYGALPEDDLRCIAARLDGAGLPATFFVNPPSVLQSLEAWLDVGRAGHEIGNAALSGVSLSGELINWTQRMVEQDLHMTQSFLEDMFEERAVRAFLYPGTFTRCADGDYREVVDRVFEYAIAPGHFETPSRARFGTRVTFEEWEPAEWVILEGPQDYGGQFERFFRRLTDLPDVEVLGVLAAARKLGVSEARP